MPGRGWHEGIQAGLLLALLVGSPSSLVASDLTSREPRIAVQVDVDDPPLTIYERGDPILPRLSSGERRLVGLALIELSMQAEYDMTIVSYSDGENLFWVSGIHLTLAYHNPEVYIAGRLRKGSCEFRATLDHEGEHVRTDREVVKSYAEKMQAALESGNWPTYNQPRQINSLEEGKAETAAKLEAIIRPIFEEMKERRREVREALDSPESYQRTYQVCTSN